ncbi:hypothetical protein QGP82_20645 [Leptothoe sp. LEGE 181152]|nr:hypothetical protein [Leptothoe sp. LEGE 181152]
MADLFLFRMDSFEQDRNDLIQLIQTLSGAWLREILQCVEFLCYRASFANSDTVAEAPMQLLETSAYESRLMQSGFIGCEKAQPLLSVNYKIYV